MLGSRLTYQKQPWEGERTAPDWQGENFRTLGWNLLWSPLMLSRQLLLSSYFKSNTSSSKLPEVFVFSFFAKGGFRKGDYPSYNLTKHNQNQTCLYTLTIKQKQRKQHFTVSYSRMNWFNVNLIAIAMKLMQAVSIFIDMDESGGRANEWIYK